MFKEIPDDLPKELKELLNALKEKLGESVQIGIKKDEEDIEDIIENKEFLNFGRMSAVKKFIECDLSRKIKPLGVMELEGRGMKIPAQAMLYLLRIINKESPETLKESWASIETAFNNYKQFVKEFGEALQSACEDEDCKRCDS